MRKWEKVISILVGNFYSGLTYLITTVPLLLVRRQRVQISQTSTCSASQTTIAKAIGYGHYWPWTIKFWGHHHWIGAGLKKKVVYVLKAAQWDKTFFEILGEFSRIARIHYKFVFLKQWPNIHLYILYSKKSSTNFTAWS